MSRSTVAVYCSGSIQKGSLDSGKLAWTDAERNRIRIGAAPLHVLFFDPSETCERLGDTVAMFGRDMAQVRLADFVVIDARERRGLGVGVEILASRVFRTPLVVVAPRNTHYRRDELEYRGARVLDYIHPHVAVLADAIVDSFEAAGQWIHEHWAHPTHIKDAHVLKEAIETYRARAMPDDEGMLTVLTQLREAGGDVLD